MREFVERMVRLRLEDLPLVNDQDEPRQLPDEAVDYILDVLRWAIEKELAGEPDQEL